MFSSPFPDFISFYCGQNPPKQDLRLQPEEQAIAESFGSLKRRAEFTLGRICAHGALSKFGLESEPILRKPETREPCWPDSVWGSITHSAGFAAVAVGLKKDIKVSALIWKVCPDLLISISEDMYVSTLKLNGLSLFQPNKQTVLSASFFLPRNQFSNAFTPAQKHTLLSRTQQ